MIRVIDLVVNSRLRQSDKREVIVSEMNGQLTLSAYAFSIRCVDSDDQFWLTYCASNTVLDRRRAED